MQTLMTLSEFVRRTNGKYQTYYSRVMRQIQQGNTNNLNVKVDGRLLPLAEADWRRLTMPQPTGRPRKK